VGKYKNALRVIVYTVLLLCILRFFIYIPIRNSTPQEIVSDTYSSTRGYIMLMAVYVMKNWELPWTTNTVGME